MKLELRAGIRVETVGNDAIVLDRSGVTFHHAVGDAAEVLRRVTSGEGDIDLPFELLPAVAALTEAGVLVPTGLSRRNLLLKGGVGVAAAGLTSFALATPAAAASLCPGAITPDTTKTFTAAGTYIPAPGVMSVVVRVWGGGGGGGRGDNTAAAGGGGGGALTHNLAVTVAECVSYPVTYIGGGGGAGATANNQDGSDGSNLSVSINTITITADRGRKGGKNGSGGNGGSMDATFVGGAGGTLSSGLSGGGGGGAGSGAVGMAGGNSAGGAGGTGTYAGGTGGNGGSTASSGATAGANGAAPGGGGGGGGRNTGALSTTNGGDGANGQAVIAVT